MKIWLGILLVTTLAGLNLYARNFTHRYKYYIRGLEDGYSGKEAEVQERWKESWKKEYLRGWEDGKNQKEKD